MAFLFLRSFLMLHAKIKSAQAQHNQKLLCWYCGHWVEQKQPLRQRDHLEGSAVTLLRYTEKCTKE
jgi:hypothetical protein